jgi:hypothetical protein
MTVLGSRSSLSVALLWAESEARYRSAAPAPSVRSDKMLVILGRFEFGVRHRNHPVMGLRKAA